jgi:putative oxidoreductase
MKLLSPLLRLLVGGAFVYAGVPKLFSVAGRHSFVTMMRAIGAPFPDAVGWLVGVLEFGGGVLLLLGAFTRLVAAVLALEVAINVIIARRRGGFPQPEPGQQPLPGYGLSALFGAGLALLTLLGAGLCSIDRLFGAAQRPAGKG